MHSSRVAIHWFRQDLRLLDNPALSMAAQADTLVPIYIRDDVHPGDYAMGEASRCWLHHSLKALDSSLAGKLNLYCGDPLEILLELVARLKITHIYWNRCYEPWAIKRDTLLKQQLLERGIEVHSTNGSLLWEPWQVAKPDGDPYKVFTPFYRKGCLKAQLPREPLSKPSVDHAELDPQTVSLESLELLPDIAWDKPMMSHWQVGEQAAHERFNSFLQQGLSDYKEGRNLPAKPFVSRLAPHLHFGEVSPNQLWYRVNQLEPNANIDHFCSELGWREFSYSLLYYNPQLPEKNLQAKFDAFPWSEDKTLLHAWQRGVTGIPMVDAGMRELWQTGYMHNRVRMIVGSFLVKNLRQHWRCGERWFWQTLLDADLANNSASWQWIAGCGADAAPYFRIFNPVSQGQKFDPDGEYVRQYLPELAELPDKYLFSPWLAPAEVLRDAGVTLGEDYPEPVVDLKQSRELALAAFAELKERQT